MNKLFDGKVVLITGASSGIGAGMAREFAAQGAHLILAARRVDRLQSLAQDLTSSERHVIFYPCDVRKDGDLERVVAGAREKLGKIDIVVANAGFLVLGDFEDLSLDDYRHQLETNVFGVLRTLYATLEDLRKTKGRLVIMGSVRGYISTAGASAYSMSKFALRALADCLRLELASSEVSVTLISPGYVESELRQIDNQGVWHPEFQEYVPRKLLLPTQKAARRIVRAIYQRRREKIVSFYAYLLIFFQQHMPRLMSVIVSMTKIKSRREKLN